MEYAKDTEFNRPRSTKFTTQTMLSLINCCKYIYKDKAGEYTYEYKKVWKYVLPVKTYRN